MRGKLLAAMLCVIIVGLALVWTSMQAPQQQRTVAAFCGAASKPVLEEATEIFEKNTGVRVELNLGGSGTMLSQMKMAKTGDLYIPGSHDYMIRAVSDGVVYPETIKTFAYLIPAIIVQKGNPKNIKSLEDLAKPGIKVGIGDPESVCVGEYAVDILNHTNLLKEVEENIVVHAASCDATAALITMGSVDAIIGWSVFESWNPDKAEAVLINPESIPKISCIPGAISTYSKNRADAEKFLNFLGSSEGRKIFEKYGYITTLEDAKKYAPSAETPKF